ncbi:methyltransferase family protein [Roseobacteraceae bacterium NS-SX3]
MPQDFQKPFTAPPAIFAAALAAGLAAELVWPTAYLPLAVQLVLGPLLMLAGVLLIRASMQEISRGGTTHDPFAASSALVTSGIYRYSRNPGYLGLAVIQTGIAVLLDSLWIGLAALAACMITSAFVIRLEEKKLLSAFGADYAGYLKSVRRWL